MEDIYFAYNPWWENKTFDYGIFREEYLKKIENLFKRKQIDIIIGSRRVGKTTILKQLIKTSLDQNIPAKNILYLALDNPRFINTPISEHLKFFRKIFMHSREERLLLFFDEIQESPNWEIELKAIYDLENTKIVCTGSTSGLKQQQGDKLTGRQIITPVYPLTFKEYLTFKGGIPSKSEDYKYEKLFEQYLLEGGYPENVLEPSLEYMNTLIDDIIARDIVRLHRINRIDVLKSLLTIIAQSVGSRSSFNKIAKVIGITVDTVKEYMSFFEEAFLIKALTKWSPSVSDKVYSQKKVYFFDTGMKTVLTGPGDIGARVENLIFLHLVKSNMNVGYYAESERELDFAYGTFNAPHAIEVKYDSDFDWQNKKYKGIKLFVRRYPGTKEVTIITKNMEKTIREDNITISAMPAWKFLLS